MKSHEQKFLSVMRRIAIAMLIFVGLVNILMGGAQTLQVILSETLFPKSDLVYILTDLLYALAYCATFILPVVFFYLMSKKDEPETLDLLPKLPEKHSVFKVFVVIFIGMSIVMTTAYLNSSLVPPIDFGDMLYGDGMQKPYQIVLTFLSTAIVPAFVEELMFRGMIYKNLRPYGRSGAIVISALLFGLMHQNAAQLFYATAAGIILAVVYELTESFWCCVLLHFFNNYFAVMQEIWVSKYPEEKASTIIVLSELCLFFLGLIFAVLWQVMRKKDAARAGIHDKSFFGRFENTGRQVAFVNGKTMVKGFLNPAMIVFLVLAFGQMILIYLLY